MASAWLSVIGIGEDGLEGLKPRARGALDAAGAVFGGERHLAMLGADGRGTPWRSPLVETLMLIEDARPQGVAVLASGDPSWFGVARLLRERFGVEALEVHPAPSAFSLAAARLGWPLESVETLSLCGRPAADLWPRLRPGRRLLVLSAGRESPAAIAAGLVRRGYGASLVHVLEHLDGVRERVAMVRADAFSLGDIAALNLVAIECEAADPELDLPVTVGLADSLFETDGTMTKRILRAGALSALAPRPGELLWDVGAGSGSITVEWLRAAPGMRAIAIEPREDRRALVLANAERLCAPPPLVVGGHAPAALDGLERPDAAFFGGGLSGVAVDAAIGALKPGGRLVAHGVTLETASLLVALHEVRGGELLRIGVESAEPLGRFRAWRAAMPVVQWHWEKPR